MVDIHKAAGIIVQDRKILVSRSKGKSYFIAPGGKLETEETPERALARELQEEQGIVVREQDLSFFGTFSAIAHGHEAEKLQIQMDVFIVKSYDGVLVPQSEIEENRWITSQDVGHVELGSIFAYEVIPELHKLNIID
jgi:mutator protein MutT